MDLQSNMQPEWGKFEQIISQFLLKSLHIILDSRVPSIHPRDRSGELSTSSRVKKIDKWFNLALGDRPAALDDLNFWRRNLMDPMIIDIILVHEGTGSTIETVIERWIVQYESPRVMSPQTGDITGSNKKAYQKSIVLFRSLYCQMRLLPAYWIYRLLTTSHTCNFDIIYKVSPFCNPFSRAQEEMMEVYNFTPIEALPGRFCISVTYCTTISDFNLEFSTPLPPIIITDYIGSPNTNPLKWFPASAKYVHTTFFPLRGIQPPPSVPLEHPHSWTSGFHKTAPYVQNQPIVGPPSIYRPPRMPCDFPSPPYGNYGNRVHNYPRLTMQRSTSYDEYLLSPPFSPSLSPSLSPSPSPSPPTGFFSGNTRQTQLHSETAPVTIPLSGMGQGSRNLSPNFSDSRRNSVPPLSPRSTKNDNSLQGSPSGIRSFRKIDASRAGDVHSRIANYGVQKFVKDNKDDSGLFSGLLSSSGSPHFGFSGSSGRLSFDDDFDDGDFSYPFDVDDVDTPDVQPSRNVDKSALESSSSLPMGRKSPGAAVGVLVHMLRTAPPLHQDPSCYSSHSLKAEIDGEVASASGVFVPRKTDDALEELRSYREMRDLLLSKSGIGVMSKKEA